MTRASANAALSFEGGGEAGKAPTSKPIHSIALSNRLKGARKTIL